jgi:hypothetical protein
MSRWRRGGWPGAAFPSSIPREPSTTRFRATTRAGLETIRFDDVGALAWYLRMVPWAVPGFDVTTHRQALEAAMARDLVVYQERFLFIGRC